MMGIIEPAKSQDQATRGRKRLSRLIIIAVVSVLLMICWLLVGVSFNFSGKSAYQELESARQVWDKQAINDYRMTVRISSYGYIGSFFFTVQDNQIVDTKQLIGLSTFSGQTPSPVTASGRNEYSEKLGAYFPENLSSYTMDGLYDFAADKLISQPPKPFILWCGDEIPNSSLFDWRYNMSFNPQLGYIERLDYSNCADWDFGGGMLCGYISHCHTGLQVTEFEPLN